MNDADTYELLAEPPLLADYLRPRELTGLAEVLDLGSRWSTRVETRRDRPLRNT